MLKNINSKPEPKPAADCKNCSYVCMFMCTNVYNTTQTSYETFGNIPLVLQTFIIAYWGERAKYKKNIDQQQ